MGSVYSLALISLILLWSWFEGVASHCQRMENPWVTSLDFYPLIVKEDILQLNMRNTTKYHGLEFGITMDMALWSIRTNLGSLTTIGTSIFITSCLGRKLRLKPHSSKLSKSFGLSCWHTTNNIVLRCSTWNGTPLQNGNGRDCMDR